MRGLGVDNFEVFFVHFMIRVPEYKSAYMFMVKNLSL